MRTRRSRPVHAHLGAVPHCWLLYGELQDWRNSLRDDGVTKAQHLVDTNGAQHATNLDRRNQQSAAVHLMMSVRIPRVCNLGSAVADNDRDLDSPRLPDPPTRSRPLRTQRARRCRCGARTTQHRPRDGANDLGLVGNAPRRDSIQVEHLVHLNRGCAFAENYRLRNQRPAFANYLEAK